MNYFKDKCMQCKKLPEYEIFSFFDGVAYSHVWFCKEHMQEYVQNEYGDEYSIKPSSPDYTPNILQKVESEASESWKDNDNPNILFQFIYKTI